MTDIWKKYVEKLMNEENQWQYEVSSSVKEGPADCVIIPEVIAALKS